MAVPSAAPPGDHLIRSIAFGGAVRIVAAIGTTLAQEAARRHNATGPAAVALGRGALASLLLATLTKGEERITVKIAGNGPLGAITVDANAKGEVRVSIKHPEAASVLPEASTGRIDLGPYVGVRGLVQVVRDLRLRELVSGQTAIADGQVDTDLEQYLSDSEQIPSVLVCDVLLDPGGQITCAAGILVQALPDSDVTDLLASLRERLRAGGLVTALQAPSAQDDAEALAIEIIGPDAGWTPLDVRPLVFLCPCSRERARATLALLGHELDQLLATNESTSVICEFCREEYDFSPEDILAVRDETFPPTGPPS